MKHGTTATYTSKRGRVKPITCLTNMSPASIMAAAAFLSAAIPRLTRTASIRAFFIAPGLTQSKQAERDHMLVAVLQHV
jgi:hypothetical protein